LSRLDLNDVNPRDITESKFADCVASLVGFPEMLSKRPVVVRSVEGTEPGAERYVAIGGNQRTRAKRWLYELSDDEKADQIDRALTRRFPTEDSVGNDISASIDTAARERYRGLLEQLLHDDEFEVELADDFTEAQALEFVVKDNTTYGRFDTDVLANHFDGQPLDAWGYDTPKAPRESKVELAPDDTRDGIGDGSSSSVPNQLVIKFDDASDVQTAESAILELLTSEGYNGFTIRPIVSFGD
jgi:hypothetical protein